MATLILKRGAERRIRAGHPWVYRGEVADLKGAWSAGAAVDVADAGGRFLGRGFYSPRSTLVCRLITREDQRVDGALVHARLEAALRYRRAAGLESAAYRLCWSEADGLPGLVVDRYGPVSVVQCLTLGMARNAEWVGAALGRLFPGDEVLRLDDPTAARIEGFEPVRDTREAELTVEEGAGRFAVSLGAGHKTGLYLDQRDNRLRLRALAADREVLDCFAYSGGFTLNALAGGAKSVTAVESSEAALALARANAELNGLPHAQWVEGDVFQRVRQFRDASRQFDLIVLDPPKFAPTAAHADRASRAYKDINLLAFKLLRPGGALMTFSCSGGISSELFQKIVAAAAIDAGVDARIDARLYAAPDHTVALNFPEGEYLKGLLCRVAG